ncbi:GATA transcription factor 23-like [Punica granatum]|uniref:GATA-type domain-containing protein n=2 Tax=Punica granatum TaxID=22663 RepID=A0A218XM60_PUNGR|nr:GATA transcription factor 23-like [Punica granatum]OWM86077.1 hypothetical protein CDL15_Pgr010901 [Punica granatum]PKI50579.1 hypothetical protein CRG98_029019 [Punica granatum]
MKNTQVPECVECHTTKTPMWRGGPAGPRSLCNACGIKYRKRNRGLLGSENRVSKKTSEDSNSSSSNSRGKQRWKLREEEEAAILLMALSCGSVSA